MSAQGFDFSDDWTATAWVDAERELCQLRQRVDGHEVIAAWTLHAVRSRGPVRSRVRPGIGSSTYRRDAIR